MEHIIGKGWGSERTYGNTDSSGIQQNKASMQRRAVTTEKGEQATRCGNKTEQAAATTWRPNAGGRDRPLGELADQQLPATW